jgi:hypothetical protein
MLLIVGVSVPGVIALRYWQTSAQRSSLLKQAREFWTKKDPARALTYLNRYLEQVPQSSDGLGLKAEILSETVVTPEQASAALAVNDQAIRALGTSANLPMKRRSVELNLRTGKYQTAITQAREILGESVNGTPGKDEPGDSKTHRLLALAMYLSDKLVRIKPIPRKSFASWNWPPWLTRTISQRLSTCHRFIPQDLAFQRLRHWLSPMKFSKEL